MTFVDVPEGFAERYEQEVLESVWQKRAKQAVAEEQETGKADHSGRDPLDE